MKNRTPGIEKHSTGVSLVATELLFTIHAKQMFLETVLPMILAQMSMGLASGGKASLLSGDTTVLPEKLRNNVRFLKWFGEFT
jgi:hypothetical protein